LDSISSSTIRIPVFSYTRGEKTYNALYVDDFIIASENEDEIARIKQLLAQNFEMKNLSIEQKFLGVDIEYGDDRSIKIHQEQYLQQILLHHGMRDYSLVYTPLDSSVKLCKTTDDLSPASNVAHSLFQMPIGLVTSTPDAPQRYTS
jgi:hypothetical protein